MKNETYTFVVKEEIEDVCAGMPRANCSQGPGQCPDVSRLADVLDEHIAMSRVMTSAVMAGGREGALTHPTWTGICSGRGTSCQMELVQFNISTSTHHRFNLHLSRFELVDQSVCQLCHDAHRRQGSGHAFCSSDVLLMFF
jgi:hypothetical protein